MQSNLTGWHTRKAAVMNDDGKLTTVSENDHAEMDRAPGDWFGRNDLQAQGVPKDFTLVRKPNTHQIFQEIEVKRTSRLGELCHGGRAVLALVFPKSNKPPIRIEVKDKFVIGRLHSSRETPPDLALNRYDALSQGVSRQHIALLKEDDTLKIMDLGSTNGTYLNGEKLMPHQPRFLRDGDRLCLGLLPVVVLFMPSDFAPDIEVSYESPTKWVVRVS